MENNKDNLLNNDLGESLVNNSRKYVVYSLWCQKERMDPNNKAQSGNMYCQGAVRNMELAKEIYPDWKFRYYVDDTVPEDIVNKLVLGGAETINVSNLKIPNSGGQSFPGMFWRFLPMNDSNVDYFIVRDVDSRINKREALAVEKWIKSEKQLHVMRDHPHHHYKILGGMWGFNCTMGRYNFYDEINRFMKARNYRFKRMDDMYFLDTLFDDCLKRDTVLQHDTFFNNRWGKIEIFPECVYHNDNTDNVDNTDNTDNTDNADNTLKYKFYRYIGEIFDENNNPVHEFRDKQLFDNKNYLKIMKNKKHLFR